MLENTKKIATRETPQTARQGARFFSTCLLTWAKKLNAPCGRKNGFFLGNALPISVFSDKLFIIKKCAKRVFKRSLKGGLKIFQKMPGSHCPGFSIFAKKEAFDG